MLLIDEGAESSWLFEEFVDWDFDIVFISKDAVDREARVIRVIQKGTLGAPRCGWSELESFHSISSNPRSFA